MVVSTEQEIKDKLKDLIDSMEGLWGELEGFEVRLDHPIVGGQRQSFADITEFNILYLHRQQIEVK